MVSDVATWDHVFVTRGRKGFLVDRVEDGSFCVCVSANQSVEHYWNGFCMRRIEAADVAQFIWCVAPNEVVRLIHIEA